MFCLCKLLSLLQTTTNRSINDYNYLFEMNAMFGFVSLPAVAAAFIRTKIFVWLRTMWYYYVFSLTPDKSPVVRYSRWSPNNLKIYAHFIGNYSVCNNDYHTNYPWFTLMNANRFSCRKMAGTRFFLDKFSNIFWR